jgi:hypothetical protein
VKRIAAVLASIGAALAITGAAGAAPVIGVAEDATKYASDGGASLFAQLQAEGMSSNRISVFWNFNDPTAIEEKSLLDQVVPAAEKSGVQLVFALYADPRLKGSVTAIRKNPDGFCNYAAEVARTYPSVTKIIVGNEPNQPRFWQPQFDAAGRGLAGGAFEAVLAKCYDALKAVNPSIDVIGVGLSPRGNDRPDAASNVSRSPVRFLHDLGVAYRASGRTLPLMDEFAFHCYPNVNTDPVSRGYPWPDVGCVNLDRLKQALWDAFDGTGQPAPPEGVRAITAAGSGEDLFGTLPLVIDETGWQVSVSGRTGYSGSENVPTVNESAQARYYAQLIGIAECDPAVTAFHFLYFLDSPQLADFQSGVEDVDGTPRESAVSVKGAIDRGCWTGPVSWEHASSVAGAYASKGLTRKGLAGVALTAKEDFSYRIVFRRAGRARAKGAAGTGTSGVETDVPVPKGYRGGTATVTVFAWANRARTTTFTVKKL